jgi:hypothetical protein
MELQTASIAEFEARHHRTEKEIVELQQRVDRMEERIARLEESEEVKGRVSRVEHAIFVTKTDWDAEKREIFFSLFFVLLTLVLADALGLSNVFGW